MKQLIIVTRRLEIEGRNFQLWRKKIKKCTTKCDTHPTPENLNDLEILQIEYDQHYEHVVQGAIIGMNRNRKAISTF